MPAPLRVGAATVALLTACGCATAIVIRLEPGEAFLPRAGKGLLIVHIDSDVEVPMLATGHFVAVHDLGRGVHLSVIEVAAGTYRWEVLRIRPFSRGQHVTFHLDDDASLSFEVRPGKLNYPGLIRVRHSTNRRIDGRYSVYADARVANRSMQAMSLLEKLYPRLVRHLAPEYSGPLRDDFLVRLDEARRQGVSP